MIVNQRRSTGFTLVELLVAMALATWLVLLVGTDVGRQLLARAPSGCRQTRPYAAKRCLFTLGPQ